MHGKNSYEKYVDLWSGKEKSIKDKIKLLFKRVGKEGHVTMDVMKRTQPKTNKIHG